MQGLVERTLSERALTPEEAAREISVGRSKIYELMSQGLPWHPLGA